MLLSVREAATLLDKSPRAVRAALARGDLPGRKDGGRWVVPREHLPLSERAHQALQQRADEIRGAVEHGLPARAAKTRSQPRRSVQDFEPFRAASAVLQELRREDPEGPANAALHTGTLALAEAWFEFQPRARLDALVRSRAFLAHAVAELLLSGEPSAVQRAARLEAGSLAGLAGLFREAERRLQRGPDELARRVRDRDFLAVLHRILEAGRGLHDRRGVRDWLGLPPDWPPPGRGLPVGAHTSQFLATHVYLLGLDHFAKRQLKVPSWTRYVDDLFLFGDGRAEVRGWRDALADWLETERGRRMPPGGT